MKNILIVGLGEVGMALYEIIRTSGKYNTFGLDPQVELEKRIPNKIDILHICFPYSKLFINAVVDYVEEYQPDLLIINSTVSPNITNIIAAKCNCLVAYSPILATHTNREGFKADIRKWGKFIGGTTSEASVEAAKHFIKLGIPIKINTGPLVSEITKLYSTTYYGMIIALAQEFHRISMKYGVNFAEIMDNICYIHGKAFNKPPAYPDFIGGHCVMSNIEILLNIYDSDLLKAIKMSNEKRKVELTNDKVIEEILATKKIVEKFWKTMRERK